MVEGGTAHGWKQSTHVSMGCPLATYIKDGGRRRPALIGCAQSVESPSRIPPPTWNRKKGREKEKEGRGRPLSLVQFRPVHGEGARPPLRPFSPFPYGPLRPNTNSRNSPVLRKIPESLGTFPMSEYSLPIYQSLRLDHFENLVMSRSHPGLRTNFSHQIT